MTFNKLQARATQTMGAFLLMALPISGWALAKTSAPYPAVKRAVKPGKMKAAKWQEAQTQPPAKNYDPVPRPPAPGAIVLFSGKPEDVAKNWYRRGSGDPGAWRVSDGAMTAGGGDIVTRENFTDFQLHLEFKEPYLPNREGQERGNSGIGLQGRYEIQVLNTYGVNEPGSGDCGALYSQVGPLQNGTRPSLTWQTYDIIFRAPRFNPKNEMVTAGSVTVWQNGMLVQNNTPITRMTGIQFGDYGDMTRPGPIDLQDHGFPVQYRNVWILPLSQSPQHYEPKTLADEGNAKSEARR